MVHPTNPAAGAASTVVFVGTGTAVGEELTPAGKVAMATAMAMVVCKIILKLFIVLDQLV